MNTVKNIWILHRWLILTLIVAWVPWMGSRLIRTTGDEKVYLAQALEMAQGGDWFVQILAGVPNYYKGPLHYILVRLGLKIFGLNLWAALYMNLIFCLIGAVALAELVREAFPQKKNWAFYSGAFLAFNLGVYGHFFSSQMEVELVGIFTLSYLALWRKKDLAFWLIAGLAGWAKSPLHSVLLGVSAIIYWAFEGVLYSRLKSWRSWMQVFSGVVLCVLGYAPAFFLDHQNFIDAYFLRETLKGSNGGQWWQSIVPILSYYLVPWMSLALLAPLECGVQLKVGSWVWKKLSVEKKSLWKLACATFLPTHLFFMLYHYRLENYALPVIASSILFILLLIENSSTQIIRWRKLILVVSSLGVLVVPFFFQTLSLHFRFSGEIWPIWFMPLLWILSLFFVGTRIREWFLLESDGLSTWSALGNIAFTTSVGVILSVLGEMDIHPVKKRILHDQNELPELKISYLDINDSIWNEWGLMSFSLRFPITPIHEERALKEAIGQAHLILARDQTRKTEIVEFARVSMPSYKPIFYPWRRWKTIHLDQKGRELLMKAWKEKNFDEIMDEGVMLRFFPTHERGSGK